MELKGKHKFAFGLRMWMTLPSIVLLIVGIIVYQKFYKLDDKTLEEIAEKLKK